MSNNNILKDDAQVSVNKGNLTRKQQVILDCCRDSLLDTMYTLPWYSRIYSEEEGFIRYYPFALSYIVEYFETDDEETRATDWSQIKFFLQDADWHTKKKARRDKFREHFDTLYCCVVKEFNLIDEERLLRFIKIIYGEYNLVNKWRGRVVINQGDTKVSNN